MPRAFHLHVGGLIGLLFLSPMAAIAQPSPPPEWSPESPSGSASQEVPQEAQELLQRGEISQGRTIGGGVLALTLRMGIGHVAQGRWREKGWIFTAGEVGSIGLLAAGMAQCQSLSVQRGPCALGIAGMAGLLGFWIWEVVDAFHGPSRHNRKVRALSARYPHAKAAALDSPATLSRSRRLRRVKLPYEEGMAIPPGSQVISRSRRELWIPGLLLFAGSYAGAAMAAGFLAWEGNGPSQERKASYLYIPIVGPFLYSPHAETRGNAVLGGVFQITGLTVFIVGSLLPKKEYLVFYAERPLRRKLALTPSLGPTGAGFQLSF